MPYRKVAFAEGEYFHLVNRGNLKCNIFKDDHDRARFLFNILCLQSPKSIHNVKRHIANFLRSGDFGLAPSELEEIAGQRFIKLIAFCLMPNHFHLLVQAITDQGISDYMQKVLNSQTKYFNAKYQQSGHLFQGPFRAVHIEDNDQLLHTSAYIHINPKDAGHRGRELKYKWSSLSDFTENNRWGQLLDPSPITDQFLDKKETYGDWLKEVTIKEKTTPLDFLDD